MPTKKIVTFQVSRVQVLDDEGRVDPELDPGLSDEALLELHRSMSLSRELDQRMLKLQRQGRIGTFPPNTGQEATPTAAALAMEEGDWLVSSYREVAARVMRGEPILNTLLYYGGYEEGSTLASEKRILPNQVILASQLLHATGIAHAMRYRGEKSAVLTFCGDGATSQGDFHEALNFAGVWKAPVVFVVQNNRYAISTPRRIQTSSDSIAQKAFGYGFPGIQIDGNDVLAAYKVVREALQRAREGHGPTLIEALTYRLGPHTTADDPKKYRSEEEEECWWGKEPLVRLRAHMTDRGIWNAELQEKMEAELEEEVAAAVKEFEDRTDFRPDAPFDHLFAEPPPHLEKQRTAFLADLERKEVGHG